MSLDLAQVEADDLLALAKRDADGVALQVPAFGGTARARLLSFDDREEFFLDINQGSISLEKITYQNRARKIFPLARLDLGGPPHQNPDGERVPCPHLHLYREGFADKWAFPLPKEFEGASNKQDYLERFIIFCNIVYPPSVIFGLQ